jgi:hypothetical protein
MANKMDEMIEVLEWASLWGTTEKERGRATESVIFAKSLKKRLEGLAETVAKVKAEQANEA